MATTVDWATKVITVEQSDMTSLGGGVYELDMDQLRLDLKALEAGEEGMPFEDTHQHNTEVTISGVTYARTVEFINGYTIEINPASAYIVSCTGANHNLSDVYTNTTGPTLLANNSAGLIVAGSGVTAGDKSDIASLVWDEDQTGHKTLDSAADQLRKARYNAR